MQTTTHKLTLSLNIYKLISCQRIQRRPSPISYRLQSPLIKQMLIKRSHISTTTSFSQAIVCHSHTPFHKSIPISSIYCWFPNYTPSIVGNAMSTRSVGLYNSCMNTPQIVLIVYTQRERERMVVMVVILCWPWFERKLIYVIALVSRRQVISFVGAWYVGICDWIHRAVNIIDNIVYILSKIHIWNIIICWMDEDD